MALPQARICHTCCISAVELPLRFGQKGKVVNTTHPADVDDTRMCDGWLLEARRVSALAIFDDAFNIRGIIYNTTNIGANGPKSTLRRSP